MVTDPRNHRCSVEAHTEVVECTIATITVYHEILNTLFTTHKEQPHLLVGLATKRAGLALGAVPVVGLHYTHHRRVHVDAGGMDARLAGRALHKWRSRFALVAAKTVVHLQRGNIIQLPRETLLFDCSSGFFAGVDALCPAVIVTGLALRSFCMVRIKRRIPSFCTSAANRGVGNAGTFVDLSR